MGENVLSYAMIEQIIDIREPICSNTFVFTVQHNEHAIKYENRVIIQVISYGFKRIRLGKYRNQ